MAATSPLSSAITSARPWISSAVNDANPSRISRDKPTTAVRGVRSSWLTLAMKAVRDLLRASASSNRCAVTASRRIPAAMITMRTSSAGTKKRNWFSAVRTCNRRPRVAAEGVTSKVGSGGEAPARLLHDQRSEGVEDARGGC